MFLSKKIDKKRSWTFIRLLALGLLSFSYFHPLYGSYKEKYMKICNSGFVEKSDHFDIILPNGGSAIDMSDGAIFCREEWKREVSRLPLIAEIIYHD